MADETDQETASSQDARLSSLDERLKRAEQAEDERRGGLVDSRAVIRSAGSQLAQNLVGMPLGGFVVGFLFDQIFGTLPWIALALMFTGFAGGVLQLMKAGKQGPDRDAGK